MPAEMDPIPLSAVQHAVYCLRQAALILALLRNIAVVLKPLGRLGIVDDPRIADLTGLQHLQFLCGPLHPELLQDQKDLMGSDINPQPAAKGTAQTAIATPATSRPAHVRFMFPQSCLRFQVASK